MNKLKQENNELKQQIVKLKNSGKDTNVITKKRKRKFKFMTVKGWCDKTNCKKCEYCKDSTFCEYLQFNKTMINTPYKTRNGKYILIEVKE